MNTTEMLRIDKVETDDGAVTLHVEGKLAGHSVGLLQKECQPLVEASRAVQLELGGVTYVDESGVKLLIELGDEDVVVSGSSGFIRERLKRGRE